MKNKLAVLLIMVVGQLLAAEQSGAQSTKKPNIIFVLVDDQGYGDVGVFFQNQRRQSDDRSKPYQLTPNLDKMAAEGAMFTDQYCNAPVCAPSRASLLTGVNQGNSKVRNNQFDKQLEDNHTMGTVMQTAGYKTVAVGKWGLQGVKEEGPNWPAHPLKRGFNDYFGYMRHKDGHEHYPHEAPYLKGKQVEVWDGYENITAGLSKCYTTDLWTAYAKKWISSHTEKSTSEPFFMYLAYDCPHAVLQLPTGTYPKGGGIEGGLQWTGQPGRMINTAENQIDSFIYPEYATAFYDDDHDASTPEKPWPETFKRYATATRRIDDAVGDIRKLLSDLKISDNTIVVFTSDNGPSMESYLPGTFVPNLPNFFDSYGPFDGIKRDCWEGGLRVPTIASWPGRFKAGNTIQVPSMLSDWFTTFADAANIQAPARTDGVSLLPALTGKGKQEQSIVYVEYFESGKTPDFPQFEQSRRARTRDQMQMLRLGNLVGVRYQVKSAEDDFEIYDVVKDPKQQRNLARNPGFEKVQSKLKAKALQLRHADKEAPRPYDAAPIPAANVSGKLQKGVKWNYYQGSFPWVASETGLKVTKHGVTGSINGTESPSSGMIIYTGLLKIPADGEYNFSLNTSGKVYLRLHDATLIDADFTYVPGEKRTGRVFLKAGYHPLKMNYLMPSDSASSKINLEVKDSQGKQLTLNNQLYYQR